MIAPLSSVPGLLVLVVGPSGVGKDSLIAAARAHHAGDPSTVFPRRVITREGLPRAEDHDTLAPEGFAAAAAGGAFALAWEAHGLAYGIPASIRDDLAAGRTVIVNVSRRCIGAAAALGFPVLVLAITAAPEVLAGRLAARGREDGTAIAQRLAREVVLDVPPGVTLRTIANDGPFDAAAAAFLAALEEARAQG